MSDLAKTILLSLRAETAKHVLVVNPPPAPELIGWLETRTSEIVQPFYPYAAQFKTSVIADIEELPADPAYGAALVFFPKNMVEGQYYLAHAIQKIKERGRLYACAHNKEGGMRLKKLLQNAELENINEISKHKARAVSGVRAQDMFLLQNWIDEGQMRPIAQHNFTAQPGIYGWNKIDKGSVRLLQHLPDTLSGNGADFGCGYGYLAHHILDQHEGVKTLHVADADARALKACAENLDIFKGRFETHWCDLTSPQKFKNLDFIVMNPPFHEGKKTDVTIGQSFIINAAKSLKKGGDLYMVANTHLPYEDILSAAFSNVEKLHEGQGFKVFKAIK